MDARERDRDTPWVLDPGCIAGIFVGGASSRMGRPKGLLPAPDAESLVTRWRVLLAQLGIPHVLVGQRAEYGGIELPQLADDPPGVGPLGGLAALLRAAGEGRALALACDMPFVTRADLDALLAAPAADIVAPRRDERWEPLCARYDAPRVLPVVRRRIAEGQGSLQGLLDELAARAIVLPARHLDDWDTPEDVTAR